MSELMFDTVSCLSGRGVDAKFAVILIEGYPVTDIVGHRVDWSRVSFFLPCM